MQTLSWTVIHWKALARKIWFPTANIFLENWIIEDWTYKINILLKTPLSSEGEGLGVSLWAWVYRKKEKLFEAHILDFEWDIYWETIEIIILEKIRENTKIHSLDELKLLIIKDIAYIKNTIFYGITFWTFDKFHPWHEFYLHNAKKYCEKLITVISTDKNVEKIKNHTPLFHQEARKKTVLESHISNLVYIWEENNHLKYIKIYKPQVIILWYDQIWFIWELEEYIKKSHYNTKIITLPSFKPEIYKSSKM